MKNMEIKMHALVHELHGQLPLDQLNEIDSLIAAGESGVAFENLCTQVFEYDIDISKLFYEKIKIIGN